MRAAHAHHVPHSEYLTWDRDDRQAEAELKAWDNEHHYDSCPQCGIHKSTWHPKFGGDIRRPSLVPEWRLCKPCQLWQTAEAAGPPTDDKDARGWHLEWVSVTYDD